MESPNEFHKVLYSLYLAATMTGELRQIRDKHNYHRIPYPKDKPRIKLDLHRRRPARLKMIQFYAALLCSLVSFCFAYDNVVNVKLLLAKKFNYEMESECVSGHLNIFNWKAMLTILHMTLPVAPVYIAILILRRLTITMLRTERAMSEYSKLLHEQLLKALTIQACLPAFFLLAVSFCFAYDNVVNVKLLLAKKFNYEMESECVSGHLNIFNWKAMLTILHMTLPVAPVYIAILVLRKLTITMLRTERAMSEYSKHLHEQLLKALTIQACLPAFFLLADRQNHVPDSFAIRPMPMMSGPAKGRDCLNK
ncbi:hypothetical protein TELCIR_01617 [Teladorsagia circumcincta]|uniref:G-protein coupled receptors family 1 profile domain-containing protein n=1 Tax=Teladorsagia circumcincta TaxID=45464 RepID=A0A2G9V1E4_TELCI|nr:hypothetical protein TELCIR_01617 [Teladorsagia circumcincta]